LQLLSLWRSRLLYLLVGEGGARNGGPHATAVAE
jgi:hypothetical protein